MKGNCFYSAFPFIVPHVLFPSPLIPHFLYSWSFLKIPVSFRHRWEPLGHLIASSTQSQNTLLPKTLINSLHQGQPHHSAHVAFQKEPSSPGHPQVDFISRAKVLPGLLPMQSHNSTGTEAKVGDLTMESLLCFTSKRHRTDPRNHPGPPAWDTSYNAKFGPTMVKEKLLQKVPVSQGRASCKQQEPSAGKRQPTKLPRMMVRSFLLQLKIWVCLAGGLCLITELSAFHLPPGCNL